VEVREDTMKTKAGWVRWLTPVTPVNLGGRDQQDHGLRPADAKSKSKPISAKKLGIVVRVCHPDYAGG
jgi:hypothetical protein